MWYVILCRLFLSLLILNATASAVEIRLVSKGLDGEAVGGDYNTFGTYPSFISRNGRYVVFHNLSPNIVDGDTNTYITEPRNVYPPLGYDVFLYDDENGSITRISLKENGDEFFQTNSRYGVLSIDGKSIAYLSGVTDAVEGINLQERVWHNNYSYANVFWYDVEQNHLKFVTKTPDNWETFGGNPVLLDKYTLFFMSTSKIVQSESESVRCIYYFDAESDTYEICNVSEEGEILKFHYPGQYNSYAVNDSGRFVVFQSDDPGLEVPSPQLVLRDRQENRTSVISLNAEGNYANGDFLSINMSGDSRYIAFSSTADNLTESDPHPYIDGNNPGYDIFLYDSVKKNYHIIPIEDGYFNRYFYMTKNAEYILYCIDNTLIRYDMKNDESMIILQNNTFPFYSILASEDGNKIAFQTAESLVEVDENELPPHSRTTYALDAYLAIIDSESSAADWSCY